MSCFNDHLVVKGEHQQFQLYIAGVENINELWFTTAIFYNNHGIDIISP